MTAVGYQYVLERLGLPVLPLSSPAAVRGVTRIERLGTSLAVPASMAPGPDLVSHLLFALKHEGTNLALLTAACALLLSRETGYPRPDEALLGGLWAPFALSAQPAPAWWAACGLPPVLLDALAIGRLDAAALAGVHPLYKVHLFFGMTVFLLFPFTRLVHIWSGFATVGYVARAYQVVRAR